MIDHAHGVGAAESCHPLPGPDSTCVLALAVNPESRVYATVEDHAIFTATRHETLWIEVAVANSGYVTAPVAVSLIAPADGSATLIWSGSPLSGSSREVRSLGIITKVTGLIDLTITFSLPSEPPDLGGRDRVHLLVRSDDCRAGVH